MALFSPFKLYSVHVDPSRERPYETAVFIPEGFNFRAFIFTEFWALYHRMWILAFLLMLIFASFWGLGTVFGFSTASLSVLQFGIRVLMGFQANDALRFHYEHKGYITVDMVAAHTLLEAELRFYDRYLPHAVRAVTA